MRPRQKNRHLPPCVYFRHGAYYLVKSGRWEPLGKDLAAALAEYGRRLQAPIGGMSSVIDAAYAEMLPGLAASTQKQYKLAANKLKKIMVEFAPEQVKPRHVAQMKSALAKTPNMANRVISFLRQVFDYALERELVDSNPVVGIKRLEEKSRGRLISQGEFDAIYVKAGPRLQVIMDLLYFTGQRVGDVLKVRRADLLEDGILFVQQKTGARLIVRWSPVLRTVTNRAGELYGNVRAFTLLHNRRGKAPDYRTVKLQWDKACKAAGVADAHLHDLRAMSISAANRQGKNARALAGHTTEAQTLRYLRDHEIPVVDGPSIGRLIDSAS